MKKVLVACEESQVVCFALRNIGIEAYSCDIIECSGGRNDWHIMQDVIPLLDGDCSFKTVDGSEHNITGKWDMIIAFPPCTHLAVSGARHFEVKRNDGRQREGINFFGKFLKCNCDHVAIENPVNIIGGKYLKEYFPDLQREYDFKKCSQIIQPYEFGDHAKKTTCLWLKGLPELIPTNIVDPGDIHISPTGKRFSKGSSSDTARNEEGKAIRWNDPETAKIRSRTFNGIGNAMALQWGKYILNL